MKRTLAILLAALTLLSLCACGGEKLPDTAATADIAASVDEALGAADQMLAVDGDYLKYSMKLDASLFAEYTVKRNAYGVNVDEYGVFKAPDEAGVAAVEQALKDYLKLREDTWMPEYMPEELPKLQSAEIKTVGLYVMYAILSEEGRASAFGAFDAGVREG